MKKLLEAINRGILKGLNESNINLLTDLDDSELDQLDSLQAKHISNKIRAYDKYFKYFPTSTKELVKIIKTEVEKKGWNCSLNHIDTSKITDMTQLFSGDGFNDGYGLRKFNGDISKWNVSNVKQTPHMFTYSLLEKNPPTWYKYQL